MLPAILRQSVACKIFATSELKLLANCRGLSSELPNNAEVVPDKYYRTKECNPVHHDTRHIGRFYTIPEEEFKALAHFEKIKAPSKFVSPDKEVTRFLSTKTLERNLTLQEQTFMVRRHYVELLDYFRQINWPEQDTVRFCLWGKLGTGKTLTLSQVHHFGVNSNYIVLNFHDIRKLVSNYREAVESEYKPGERWDFPMESQELLAEFKRLNHDKLDGLVTHKAYQWSEAEGTPKGEPLADVVELGLNRPRFAQDCLNVLVKELKLNFQDGWNKHPLLVIVDGINVIFQERTYVTKSAPRRHATNPIIPKFISEACRPDELGLIVAIKHLLKSDYKNTAIVASLDRSQQLKLDNKAVARNQQIRKWWFYKNKNMTPTTDPDYPFAILGDQGWEKMHPFVPIEVTNYTDGEMDAVIDYYVDKSYVNKVAGSDLGRQEIKFLTAKNPGEFAHWSILF